MTHKLFIVTSLSALLFLGCAKRAPDLNGRNNILDTDSINGDRIDFNENKYSDSNGTGIIENGIGINENTYSNNLSTAENAYSNNVGASSTNNYNSSSNNFKSIYFAFDKYGISSNMENNMRTNIKVSSSTSSKIKIEGNCDEFGTDEYNYALGLKRAKSVKDGLVSAGISPSKIVMVSLGESSPICKTSDSACYEKNRRVDLRLVR